MAYVKYLVAAATLSLALIGCSSPNKKVFNDPPNVLFTAAQQKLQDCNFKSAIAQLEALDKNYPLGPYSQQAQLALIYAYYKSADLSMAKTSIRRFIRLNPTHPNIDYVMYMHGLTNMALSGDTLQEFFGTDRSDRDPRHARAAFRDFSQLIHMHPDSQYAADATKRLLFLKNHLAKYELSVAQYYTERGAPIAVVNRVEQMLKDYPDTKATLDALPLMKSAYLELQLNNQADKVKQIIAANK